MDAGGLVLGKLVWVATFGRYQASPPLRCGLPIAYGEGLFGSYSIPQDHRGRFATVTDLPGRRVQASCDHKIHLGHGSAPRDTGTLQHRYSLAVQSSLMGNDRVKTGRIGTLPQLVVAVKVPRMKIFMVAPERFLRPIERSAPINIVLDDNRP